MKGFDDVDKGYFQNWTIVSIMCRYNKVSQPSHFSPIQYFQ